MDRDRRRSPPEKTFRSLRPDMERLARRLSRPLPGLAAQREMAPVGRISINYDAQPPGARASAVLLLLTDARDLVFIRRTDNGGHHGGQIAFPGGAREDHDRDLTETALRETEEEIGVMRDSVTVLGLLTPLYIPVTNYTVQPVVGIVPVLPKFRRQPDEVDEVIVLSVAGVGASRDEFTVRRAGVTYRAPCYRFHGGEVWGATAMILSEFLLVLHEATDAGDLTGMDRESRSQSYRR